MPTIKLETGTAPDICQAIYQKAMAAGLTGQGCHGYTQWGRLTAAEQRQLFGGYLFGRQAIHVHSGGVTTRITVALDGGDWQYFHYFWDELISMRYHTRHIGRLSRTVAGRYCIPAVCA